MYDAIPHAIPSDCSRVELQNEYFTEMCSGSEAGSHLRLIDCVYHSTLGWTVMNKKKKVEVRMLLGLVPNKLG